MSKVALVTGASRGIGLAISRKLAEMGYTVYGAARVPFSQPGVISVQLDVTKPEQIEQAVEDIIQREGRLDLLVNNAGMGISGAVEKTAEEEARYIFDVNLFGPFFMIKKCLPYLRESKGRIINISSVASRLCIPFQAFYSSTKAALEALSYALMPEVAPFGVKVTNILPGDTRTNFTDARKKSFEKDDPVYGERIWRSVGVMEKDERGGMSPEKVANAVAKVLKRKNPPVIKTVGFQYKLFLFLNRLLPKKLVIWIIGKLYG